MISKGFSRGVTAFILLIATSGSLLAEGKITSISIYPPDIHLNTARDFQQFIVVANRDDGVTLDVTSQATVKLASPKFTRIEDYTIYPLADGATTLDIQYQGFKAAATIDVKGSTVDQPVSFHLDIMPIFLRSGCNTGSCHGSSSGKDGFRLSIFGFDPVGDHYRVTRELGTRRINLAVPEESLLIEKSIGSVPHTGGKRFKKGSEYYNTMLRWLKDGALIDKGDIPQVVGVDIYPPKAVMEGKGSTQQFISRARFSDGSDRDITSLTVFMTNNESSAPMTDGGLVTAADRGEAFVMARYETKTVGSQILVLPKGLKYTPPKVTGNYIDELIADKLIKIRMLPSGICTDEEFLRRITIDITGMLPSEEDYHAFMSDKNPKKRGALVDSLLTRKEFSDIWAMKWAELLMIKSSNQVSYKSAYLYYSWLNDKIARNVPLDQMVRDLLGATGGTFTSPATNYYQIERNTLKTAENVAQVFMGIRTQCAQCHNHPFDRWTMDDYYSFAAFFAQIGRKTGEDYREQIIYNRGSGNVRHKVGNRIMKPKYLGGDLVDTAGKDLRVLMAQWLTSTENPLFSTSIANRVWSHFFGMGIVEPVDDIRVSNPASNPELFAALGDKLVEYKFDFKRLVRDICNSNAYQRSTLRNKSNEGDTKNFAHGNVRRIQAEMLLDCISQVTETKDKFRGLPLGARAVHIADGKTGTYFLTTFGRAPRNTVCACEANTDPTLSQSLHMLNGTTIEGKVTSGGVIKRMLAEKKKPEQIIESLYIRSLSRKPTAEEIQRLIGIVGESTSPQAGLDDVFWAVLNSREFLFNH